jgi:hypothetical protein
MLKETNKQPRTGMQRKQLFGIRNRERRKKKNKDSWLPCFFFQYDISLCLPPIVGASLTLIRKSCERELEEEFVMLFLFKYII